MRIARVIAWVFVVLVCGVAFVRSGSALLLAAAIAAVIVPLAGWMGALLAAKRMHVRLTSPTTAPKGSAVALEIEFANGSRLPVASVCADVRVRNLLTGNVAVLPIAASMPPRSRVSVPVDLSSVFCGRLECTVERVRLFEVFRIFSHSADCSAERRLTIMPELHEARLRDVYAASPLSDTTVFSPYVRGSDLSEVFGLREYEAGDEMKRIHWKLSEKIDKVIVRDASLPLDNALLLFWDKRVSDSADADEAALSADTMAEVVLALMERLARMGISFELASNDIPADRCTRSFVTDENDIYEVIGHLLSSPIAHAAESGLAGYIRFYGSLSCSQLLYVCCERPDSFESFLGARDATLIICDGGTDVARSGAVSEIHFSPGDARGALDMLGVM